jgi:hypothetical protein
MSGEGEGTYEQLGLRPIGVDFAARVSLAAAANGKSLWYYYAPFLIGFGASSGRQVLVGEHGGSLVLLVHRDGPHRRTCDLIVPPLPLSEAALNWSRDRADSLAPAAPKRILWCDEGDARVIEGLGLGLPVPQPPDLLYDPREVAGLGGGEFSDVRKRIHRVLRERQVRLRRPTATDTGVCLDLLQLWFEQRVGAIHPIGDMGYSRGALPLLGLLRPMELDAMLYEVDGEPSALSIGGMIRPGLTCFFLLKARPDVAGLSTFARWETLCRWQGLGLVNDGSALGRDGLLQHKRKFRPCAELPVYQVRLT